MMRVALLFLFLLLPISGRAEVISVTSGEHVDFSRLVLSNATTTGWNFARTDGGFEFQAADKQDSFNLNRAFERIPRDRIIEAQDRGEGRLFLAVTCDCHANVTVVGAKLIAMDFYDGAPPADLATLNSPPNVLASGDSSLTQLPLLDLPLLTAERVIPILPSLAYTLPNGFWKTVTVDTSIETSSDSGAIAAPRDMAQETEAALLEQIARAASQGLLDANVANVTSDLVPDEITPQLPEMAEPPIAIDQNHVSVTTSVDLANRELRVVQTEQGSTCIPDRFFDIETWGEANENGVDIGSYRSKIIGEFDEADSRGIMALVRNYIYITFGAEANALINQYQSDFDRPDLLRLMADVMDDGQSSAATRMIDQLSCNGRVALWAAAAQPKLYKYQAINVSAVRLAFGALPPHLRRHIGPTLGSKFLAIEDKVTADALYDATARVLTEPLPQLTLLEARTDLSNGMPDRARDRLDEVVNQSDDILPEALIERVEAALANDEAVPDDVISLVQSVGFEYRGTPVGAALARAEIRALASASLFEVAFSRFKTARMDGTVSGTEAIDLSREIFSLLAVNASDQEFLTRIVAWTDEAGALAPPDRRIITKRLVDLGFPDQGRAVLGQIGTMPEIEDRILFARIAIAQIKPRVAIGYLAGIEGEEALRLRAEAMSIAEDHEGAMESFDALGDDAARNREAWRGGFWEDLATRGEGPFSATGQLIVDSRKYTDLEGEPALGRDNALIETSRSSREIIELLLSEISTQANDTPTNP